MKNWDIWMMEHRLSWLLQLLVVISLPLHLLVYWGEAVDDMQYTLRSIREYKKDKTK
ncbi:hypothetical protein UFOVP56_54 [uncultured Caudovirales phage]|uniref:Uncharacterized protein n=1 Tax=uncultured Caudovirales phage TaxID=2100421 RepID=A0A6J5TB10_9CAUD|nr:hypothetical protein UFOVP56_54 [uncultured Caudovirales phage]